MAGDVIKIDPGILGGTPCIAGTRVPIKSLYDHLKLGHSVDQFIEEFPTVERLLDQPEHELPDPRLL